MLQCAIHSTIGSSHWTAFKSSTVHDHVRRGTRPPGRQASRLIPCKIDHTLATVDVKTVEIRRVLLRQACGRQIPNHTASTIYVARDALITRLRPELSRGVPTQLRLSARLTACMFAPASTSREPRTPPHCMDMGDYITCMRCSTLCRSSQVCRACQHVCKTPHNHDGQRITTSTKACTLPACSPYQGAAESCTWSPRLADRRTGATAHPTGPPVRQCPPSPRLRWRTGLNEWEWACTPFDVQGMLCKYFCARLPCRAMPDVCQCTPLSDLCLTRHICTKCSTRQWAAHRT